MNSTLQTLVEKRELAIIESYISGAGWYADNMATIIFNDSYNQAMEDAICHYYEKDW